MKEKVETAIEQIRPSLQADGGDIKLISVDESGVVKIRFHGACAGCPMSQMTLEFGVKQNLKQLVPEVIDVISV